MRESNPPSLDWKSSEITTTPMEHGTSQWIIGSLLRLPCGWLSWLVCTGQSLFYLVRNQHHQGWKSFVHNSQKLSCHLSVLRLDYQIDSLFYDRFQFRIKGCTTTTPHKWTMRDSNPLLHCARVVCSRLYQSPIMCKNLYLSVKMRGSLGIRTQLRTLPFVGLVYVET